MAICYWRRSQHQCHAGGRFRHRGHSKRLLHRIWYHDWYLASESGPQWPEALCDPARCTASGPRSNRSLSLGRFLSQLVKLTSNPCAPIEEAKPSVSPARYMTTPFPFVSLACIFPSIRVSPLLTPRYVPEKSERRFRL